MWGIDTYGSVFKKYHETITGGEPLMWNMNPLTRLLKQHNIRVHIETSGSNKLTGEWDWICLSPKKRKLPTDEVCDIADELKVIVYNNSDFKFAINKVYKELYRKDKN